MISWFKRDWFKVIFAIGLANGIDHIVPEKYMAIFGGFALFFGIYAVITIGMNEDKKSGQVNIR